MVWSLHQSSHVRRGRTREGPLAVRNRTRQYRAAWLLAPCSITGVTFASRLESGTHEKRRSDRSNRVRADPQRAGRSSMRWR